MSETKQVRMREWDFNGIKVICQDLASSGTLDFIAQDIMDNAYGLHDIKTDQRVILDIGAHVGMVAIYLAKKYPQATIYAVEPFPTNISNLRHNLVVNEVVNVHLLPCALSKDSRLVRFGCFENNTGGVIEQSGPNTTAVESITLDRLIDTVINRHSKGTLITFLKMDIEGFEYEILPEFKQWDKILDAGIEVHNRLFDMPGYLDEIQKFKDFLHKQPIKGRMWTPPIEAFERQT